MPKTTKTIFLFLVFLMIIIGVVYLLASRIPKKQYLNGRVQLITSFYPLSYIANAVGGDFVHVRYLVPAGVESHDFEPSFLDLAEIGKADAFVYNGANFEAWIEKWERSGTLRPNNVINIATELNAGGIELIRNNGNVDPHFWLDPVVMKKETEIIRDLLVKIDPMRKDFYTENTLRLISSLDELDRKFRDELASCQLREIIVLHEAFEYLARQYKFSATAISGISPDEEPSSKELASIINLARAKNIKYVFTETIASPKFSELIAREIGGKVITLNPVEGLTPNEVQLGEDYVLVMEKNLSNLKNAMSCH